MGMAKSGIGYVNERFGNEPGKVPLYGWNPGGMGCSGGCECCWARKLAKARGKCPKCKAFTVHIHPERFPWLAKKKKSSLILANFTNDTFDFQRPLCDIRAMIRAAEAADHHTYVWLTQVAKHARYSLTGAVSPGLLGNHYLGITVRNQDEANKRLPVMAEISANLWVSYEPAWASVDFTAIRHREEDAIWRADLLAGTAMCVNSDSPSAYNDDGSVPTLKGIICGHDNRPGAPGTDTLDHIRSVVQQCKAAGVNCYVKQIWIPWRYPDKAAVAGMRDDFRFLRASKPDEYALYPFDLMHRALPWDKAKI